VSRPRLIHRSWPVSPYSAKTRAYLRFKQVDFEERQPSVVGLMWTVRRAVGRAVMPTVQVDDDWLQDSSVIIDTLEQRLEGPSIRPPGPTQHLASLLLELHGDEWAVIPAMHFRWNRPQNKQFAIAEFARCGAPWLPGPLGRRLVGPVADRMQSYLPVLGVHPHTESGVASYTRGLIAQLQVHLARYRYVLGDRPCLGDFALYGPLWAHLYRDPGSRELFDEAPDVVAWFERLRRPPKPGAFLERDVVPETLDPIFRTLFAEQWPYLQVLVARIDAWCSAHPGADRVPRALGTTQFTIGGEVGERKLVTFGQFMLQRPVDHYQGLTGSARASAERWLTRVGGREALSIEVRHPMIYRNHRPVLAHAL